MNNYKMSKIIQMKLEKFCNSTKLFKQNAKSQQNIKITTFL